MSKKPLVVIFSGLTGVSLLTTSCLGLRTSTPTRVTCLNGTNSFLANNGTITGIELPPGTSCTYRVDINTSDELSQSAEITVYDNNTKRETQRYTTQSGQQAVSTTISNPQLLVKSGATNSNVTNMEDFLDGIIPSKNSYYLLQTTPGEILKFPSKPKIMEIGATFDGKTILYFDVAGSNVGVVVDDGFMIGTTAAPGAANQVGAGVKMLKLTPSDNLLDAYNDLLDTLWDQIDKAISSTKIIIPATPTLDPSLPTQTPSVTPMPGTSLNAPVTEFTYVDHRNTSVTFNDIDGTFYDQAVKSAREGEVRFKSVGDLSEYLKVANRADVSHGHESRKLQEIIKQAKSIMSQQRVSQQGDATTRVVGLAKQDGKPIIL